MTMETKLKEPTMNKPMRVRDLITALQGLPPDAFVYTEDDDTVEDAYEADPDDDEFKGPAVLMGPPPGKLFTA
jgi:hypothetical protein